MIDLDAELWRAIAFAKAAAKRAFDLSPMFSPRVQWGLARVEWWGLDRHAYEPQTDGSVLAVLAPVVEAGELIDLAAIDPWSQHLGLRVGVGHALGIDAIEKARMRCCDLGLMARPLDWLRDPVDNVYLFDLAKVALVLDGVPEFTCSSLDFATRVRCMFPPSRQAAVLAP